ncbi:MULTISPECIES: type VII secretion protein EssB [unclassified Granulicatella]|uniref:type VII secretion protein EssB n=1 Tax=unclassified Granulicatella TaxID=2630493 RepID=UPI001073B4C5|nr:MULTISPECIES: type VII secretion protein EssB [unclassified Granulicatella]MBF0780479.1 type VII secretion protein EssB [Granulicatella sp. 19428wC4_WM01]TFU95378.1 type VII secretion protein EssB [Granulicatella sp. WM01]
MEKKNITRELLLEDIKGNKAVAYALLQAQHPSFIDETLTIKEDVVTLNAQVDDEMYDWQTVTMMTLEDRVRHLMNCGHLYDALKNDKYTYKFAPEHIVFTVNGLPKLTYRGIRGQVVPYESVQEEKFLTTYQAMIVSLLDLKVDYNALINGKLPFYKGDLLCESVIKAQSVSDVLQLLQDKYVSEKEINQEHYIKVKKTVLSGWKITTIATSVLTSILLIGIVYLLLFALPNQTAIADIRLAFIQKDYSKVLTTVRTKDSRSLSQDDKYIVAYSVIMSEPLSEAQKQELSRISTQSNEDYLRYWVLIGQSKIDEAIDIASYLDDPQLLMYGMTKKIDDIQRDPNLKSEERTEAINNYKSKLDELKKKYLTPPTNGTKQGVPETNQNTNSSTTTPNDQ